MTLAVAMPTAAQLMTRALERDYVRDSEGQFADVPGVPVVGDKLKLAGRMQLGSGEKLLSSRRIRSGQWDVLAAEINTPNGREVRLGVIDPGDRRKWTGGPDPQRSSRVRQLDQQMTAMLDAGGDDAADTEVFERLRDERDELAADSDDFNRTTSLTSAQVGQLRSGIEVAIASARAMIARGERPDSGEFASGVVPGGLDGDAEWRLDDAGTGEDDDWLLWLAIRPHGEGDDWLPEGDDTASFDPKNTKALLSALDELAGFRSPESFNQDDLGVHSMPLSRAIESFAVMSPSPAVRLMMLARTLEAKDSFSRRGRLVTVERGRGGKFAESGMGDAVGKMVDAFTDAPKKPRAPRNAVAKALASGDSSALDGMSRESLRREAKARGIDVPRGVSEDVLKDMLWDDENSSKSDGAASAMADGFGGKSLSSIGQDSSEEEIFAAFSRAGSEQEIRDGLAGKSADELKFIGDEIGVRTHRNETDPDRIRQHIARSVAVGLSNVAFRPRNDETSAQKRSRADSLLSDMPSDQAGRDRVHTEVGGLILDADRMDAAAKPSRSRAPVNAATMRTELAATPDADSARAILRDADLSQSQARVLAKDLGVKSAGRSNVDDAIEQMVQYFHPGASSTGGGSQSKKSPADTDAAADRIRSLPHRPESRAALAAELDQLGAADMRAVADKWNIPLPKRTTKAQSRKAIEDRLDFLIDHESVVRGGGNNDRAPATEIEAKNYFAEFKAGHKAAVDADRERLAAKKTALSAARLKRQQPTEERQSNLNAISGGDIWAKLRQAHEDEGAATKNVLPAGTAAASKRMGGPIARKPKESERPDRAEQMAAIAGDDDIWGKLRKMDEETAARRAAGGSPVSSAVDALRPMVDNPQRGDREKTAEILGKLTGKQLEEVAQSFGSTVSHHRTVAEKRTQLTERLVGFGINSLILRTSAWTEHADATKRS